MTYKPHQIKAANQARAILKTHGVSYIMGLPRTGKTRAAIRVFESVEAHKSVLVLTKKAAIPGWLSELKATNRSDFFHVTNYEQAKKLKPTFSYVILDESHNLGQVGKPSQRVKDIRALAYNCPLLCLSGTPLVETPLAIYHQFCITKYSPFAEYKNFYRFFDRYGIPSPAFFNNRKVETYKKYKPQLLHDITPFIVRITQEEAGIKHTARDEVHEVELTRETTALMRDIITSQVFAGEIVESDMKERALIHQLETGAFMREGKPVMLPNVEFVDYIKRFWGDCENVGLMCHYQSTRAKLKRHFPYAPIYSSNAHSEGVDLSHLDSLVIVNSDYSGARFIQRRERLTNMNRDAPITIHHLTTYDGISGAVYDAVAEKRDFNLQMYKENARTIHTN